MIYIHLTENSVKILSLSRTMLGQYGVNFFEKTHSVTLLESGRVKSVDLLASAIKEALTEAKPSSITDHDVTLILPQESFDFARYSVPADISDSAILSFIKDKVRSDVRFELENSRFDYSVSHKTKESTVLLFAIKNAIFDEFATVTKLLQLHIKNLIPETLAYYKLFEKALREDKKETLLYAFLNGDHSYAYLFDYLGLIEEKKYHFKESGKEELKKIVDDLSSKNISLNRLILSGQGSSKVRQDLFTKEVGVWTNPLEKIIANFYGQYVKLLIPNSNLNLPILHFDACLGGFIFTEENTAFSLLKAGSRLTSKGRSLPKLSLPALPLSKKAVFIFIFTFLLSTAAVTGAFIFAPQLKSMIPQSKPTPTPTSVPSPTAIPELSREEVNIQVLNGTGRAGVAGEIRDALLEAGYTEVLTDNAESFDFVETEISVKEEKEAYAQMVTRDLKDVVEINESEISTLDEDDPADLIITIGSDYQ